MKTIFRGARQALGAALLLAAPLTAVTTAASAQPIVEIRCYNLQPGSRPLYTQLLVDQALPMLLQRNITVLSFGPSIQDSNAFYLVRAYNSLEDRHQKEASFYGSDEWKQHLKAKVESLIVSYTTLILPADSIHQISDKLQAMQTTTSGATTTAENATASDSATLSALNAQFIHNFITKNVSAHDQIIYKDFVCIQNDGTIVPRAEYLKEWATAYDKSGYTDFAYTDEHIRIFGDVAFIRAKTVYTKTVNGQTIHGNSVYTDTYFKTGGRWWCVQAQITPVAAR